MDKGQASSILYNLVKLLQDAFTRKTGGGEGEHLNSCTPFMYSSVCLLFTSCGLKKAMIIETTLKEEQGLIASNKRTLWIGSPSLHPVTYFGLFHDGTDRGLSQAVAEKIRDVSEECLDQKQKGQVTE